MPLRSLAITVLLVVLGCDLSQLSAGADEKFGNQNFKSAVALVELHRTRTGEYPRELSDLEFLGDWDQIWLNAVRYERVEGGYNLFVERGWIGEPSISLPESYRTGLGIEETNVAWVSSE